MMQDVVLITDNPTRSRGLRETLASEWTCHLIDLADTLQDVPQPTVIVSDVAKLSSSAVLRLRTILQSLRQGAPFLVLLHVDTYGTRVQSQAMGATRTIPVASPDQVRLTVQTLLACQEPTSLSAERLAKAAQRFLVQSFRADATIKPDEMDRGADLIGIAVREAGVRDWITAVRRFDDHTHQHCLLVAGLAAAYAKALGFAEADTHVLTKAALLHDVGKIHIPTSILNKAGDLNEAEITVMRQHPALGVAMLRGQDFPPSLIAVVRSHHEMLDGSGYPDKLKGRDIPDLVRLVTICDIYAALIERRSYKAPLSSSEAFNILDGMVGKVDADLLQAFRLVVATPA